MRLAKCAVEVACDLRDDCPAEGGGEVLARHASCGALRRKCERGLHTAEGKVEAGQRRDREVDRARVPRVSDGIEPRAAGIPEVKKRSRLVERFSSSVVHGGTEEFCVERATEREETRMPTRGN